VGGKERGEEEKGESRTKSVGNIDRVEGKGTTEETTGQGRSEREEARARGGHTGRASLGEPPASITRQSWRSWSVEVRKETASSITLMAGLKHG
jgi:hypothetical protein